MDVSSPVHEVQRGPVREMGNELAQAQERGEEMTKTEKSLIELALDIIDCFTDNGWANDVDGGYVQDSLENLKLITKEEYHLDRHGELGAEFDEGDEIFVLTPEVLALQKLREESKL